MCECDKDNYKRREIENVTTFISDNCENGNDAEVIHVTVCIWNMGEYWRNVTLFQISYVMVVWNYMERHSENIIL